MPYEYGKPFTRQELQDLSHRAHILSYQGDNDMFWAATYQELMMLYDRLDAMTARKETQQ